MDRAVYREARALAIKQGRTVGEALEDAVLMYVAAIDAKPAASETQQAAA